MMARPTVVVELAADAQHARDLSAGGVFVAGCGLAIDAECELVVRGATDELRFDARVVCRDATRGAGLELVGFGPAMREQLAVLIAATPVTLRLPLVEPNEFEDMLRDIGALGPPHGRADDPDDRGPVRDRWVPRADGFDDDDDTAVISSAPPRDDRTESPELLAVDQVPDDDERLTGDQTLDDAVTLTRGHRTIETAAPAGDDQTIDEATGDERDPDRRPAARNVHERLRNLPLAQQLKKAHTGELQERVVLERMYGKTVWEPLLRNPRLTPPEVARIARMGQLPRPLIEIIVGNGAWLQIPEVRRALLANPRLATDQIMRVLRLLPKHELKLAATQAAYSHAVRDVAKRLLKELV